MRSWLIRQDRPNGGVLSFAGDPAFEAHWMLSEDPPTENAPQQGPDERYWFRTGDDDDDLIVQFFNLHWEDTPPKPALARRLMAKAVIEINQMIGERF
jgi:hypothetical protein